VALLSPSRPYFAAGPDHHLSIVSVAFAAYH
jgi:hypothetical protein